ncbi:MAG: GNAT family N-acetyltransferase [Atopobiaceae bacterium]|nr:GNAT family N-acetyltransferase [Atopobiaceae bacterium]
MTAEELWDESGLTGSYEAWAFGGAPDKLANLVACGIKTATCSSLELMRLEGEPMPKPGDHSVILDSAGDAICVIRTTKVYVETFEAVTQEHAYKEGEGDRSLSYWRRIHMEYFTEELAAVGLPFDEDCELVCEEFEVVYARVELKPIAEDNFVDAFNLSLAPGQEEWVSHPVRSLAQAYVYRDQCQPFGIYADDRMVGYVMVVYDYDIPEYDIWHMVIDETEQGRGYGGDALDLVLDFIRTKPFGDSNRVALTCHRENRVALSLYEKKGFTATGAVYDDEIELATTVG